jgi:hypothetical protein
MVLEDYFARVKKQISDNKNYCCAFVTNTLMFLSRESLIFTYFSDLPFWRSSRSYLGKRLET